MTTTPTMNVKAMQQLSARVDGLISAGLWDEQSWNAALDEAAEYACGVSGARDWLLSEALDSKWLERRMQVSRVKDENGVLPQQRTA